MLVVMARNSDTSYMERHAEYSVESIDRPGIDEVLECPADLIGEPKLVFERFAADGIGKFRYEDVPALVELSRQVVLAEYWDAACSRLCLVMSEESATNDKGAKRRQAEYDRAERRAEKASRRASVLRKELGINPMARVSVASRRRGAATLKMNGAPDTLGAARDQAFAVLEETRRVGVLTEKAGDGSSP